MVAAGVYRTPVRSVMLVDDGVDAEQFRRLRVRLRLEGPGLGGTAVSGPRAVSTLAVAGSTASGSRDCSAGRGFRGATAPSG